MSNMFVKARRKRAFLNLALTGPSGSGKTWSALELATGLVTPGGKIALLDTENESASLYSHQFDFDTCPLSPPFTPERYMEIIAGAVAAGYEVLVIDSLSHEWVGEGGILAMKESKDARGGNAFTNWAEFTKRHENFKSAIQQSAIHIISTMRSKQEYVVDQSGGKSAPRKVGMAAIQREGFEYEFTSVLDISMNHEAAASKDRTGVFVERIERITRRHGAMLREWLEGGGVEEARREETPVPSPLRGDNAAVASPSPEAKPANVARDRFDAVAKEHGLSFPSGKERGVWMNRFLGRDDNDATGFSPDNWSAAADSIPAKATLAKAKRDFGRQASEMGHPVKDADDKMITASLATLFETLTGGLFASATESEIVRATGMIGAYRQPREPIPTPDQPDLGGFSDPFAEKPVDRTNAIAEGL